MQQQDECEYVYRTQKIESISNIAARFGVTVKELVAFNPQLKGKLFVDYGQELIMPQSRGVMAALTSWDRAALLTLRTRRKQPTQQQQNDKQTAAASYTTNPEVVLSARVADVVRRIDEEYSRRTNTHLHVTSGTRTARSQAEAMYVKLNGGDSLAVYANQAAVTEIRTAYRNGTAARRSRDQTISDMEAVITSQIGRGVFISGHLRAGAVDLRSRDMSQSQQTSLREAVTTVGNVIMIYERTPPHFHLQIN